MGEKRGGGNLRQSPGRDVRSLKHLRRTLYPCLQRPGRGRKKREGKKRRRSQLHPKFARIGGRREWCNERKGDTPLLRISEKGRGKEGEKRELFLLPAEGRGVSPAMSPRKRGTLIFPFQRVRKKRMK